MVISYDDYDEFWRNYFYAADSYGILDWNDWGCMCDFHGDIEVYVA